jgi:hypothetical protein
MIHCRTLACAILIGALCHVIPQSARADVPGSMSSHRTVSGVVLAERSGLLTVKTETGTQVSISASASSRHGHRIPKVGEDVTLTMDENHTVIDVHPKGEEGQHQ